MDSDLSSDVDSEKFNLLTANLLTFSIFHSPSILNLKRLYHEVVVNIFRHGLKLFFCFRYVIERKAVITKNIFRLSL